MERKLEVSGEQYVGLLEYFNSSNDVEVLEESKRKNYEYLIQSGNQSFVVKDMKRDWYKYFGTINSAFRSIVKVLEEPADDFEDNEIVIIGDFYCQSHSGKILFAMDCNGNRVENYMGIKDIREFSDLTGYVSVSSGRGNSYDLVKETNVAQFVTETERLDLDFLIKGKSKFTPITFKVMWSKHIDKIGTPLIENPFILEWLEPRKEGQAWCEDCQKWATPYKWKKNQPWGITKGERCPHCDTSMEFSYDVIDRCSYKGKSTTSVVESKELGHNRFMP